METTIAKLTWSKRPEGGGERPKWRPPEGFWNVSLYGFALSWNLGRLLLLAQLAVLFARNVDGLWLWKKMKGRSMMFVAIIVDLCVVGGIYSSFVVVSQRNVFQHEYLSFTLIRYSEEKHNKRGSTSKVFEQGSRHVLVTRSSSSFPAHRAFFAAHNFSHPSNNNLPLSFNARKGSVKRPFDHDKLQRRSK